jgi:uncharacterized protein YejL (UPF0352 family)
VSVSFSRPTYASLKKGSQKDLKIAIAHFQADLEVVPLIHIQKVSKFAEAATLSKWHDEGLQQCTKELNATLDKYMDIRRNEFQMLSFLITPKGFFLVWALEVETVGEEDDDETIVRELGIKTESSTTESTEYEEKSNIMLAQPAGGWTTKKFKKISGGIECYGKGNKCAVANIVEAARLTKFHDENLQQCTRELNAILNKYNSKSERPNRELRILSTPEGPFLCWAGTSMGSSEDDAETILKGLGIE